MKKISVTAEVTGLLPKISNHARVRMCGRRISEEDIESALLYGRSVHTRGAVIYAVGHKESQQWRMRGVNLERCEGLQVVCSHDGAVITAYRNRNFAALRH